MTNKQRERWAGLVELLVEHSALLIGDRAAQDAIRLAAFLRSDECPRDGDLLFRRMTAEEVEQTDFWEQEFCPIATPKYGLSIYDKNDRETHYRRIGKES